MPKTIFLLLFEIGGFALWADWHRTICNWASLKSEIVITQPDSMTRHKQPNLAPCK